jgi:CRP-like cAMP-binding protein
MPADTSLLLGVPIFQLLDPDERELLAQHLDEVQFEAGQKIFNKGDPGDAIFVVNSGEVLLSFADSTGERVVLETSQPGDFFGELSLLDGGARSSDATAIADTHALRVDRGDLEMLFQHHPDAALDFLTVMGRRLRESTRLLQYRQMRSPNQEIEQRKTPILRFADFVSDFSGRFSFLLAHAGWFAAWILLNANLLPGLAAFDPFPFGLLTMVVSLEAIFLSCIVLISQNRQVARDRIRSEVEFEANIKAGLEVSQLHVKLDRLYEETARRLAALEQGGRG